MDMIQTVHEQYNDVTWGIESSVMTRERNRPTVRVGNASRYSLLLGLRVLRKSFINDHLPKNICVTLHNT